MNRDVIALIGLRAGLGRAKSAAWYSPILRMFGHDVGHELPEIVPHLSGLAGRMEAAAGTAGRSTMPRLGGLAGRLEAATESAPRMRQFAAPGAAPVATAAGAAAPAAAGRTWRQTLGRGAGWGAGIGAAGLGTAAAGTGLWNARQNTVGRSINPLTWVSPNSAQDVFDRRLGTKNNPGDYLRLQQQANQEIDEAMQRGDTDEAARLQQELKDQTYGSSFLGGINPWAGYNMRQSADVVRSLRDREQPQYNAMKARLDTRRGQMSPEMVKAYRDQLAGMKRRMDATNALPGSTPTPDGEPRAAGNWRMGYRPAGGGWMLNPYDFRRDPSTASAWEETMQRPGVIRGAY